MARYGNMKKTTLRLDQDVFDAIQAQCERHGDFQWLVNKCLKAAFCKTEKPKKPRQAKSEFWKRFYKAYPPTKKGGSDATAWKAAQRKGLTDSDFDDMYQDVIKRKESSRDWYEKYAYGVTKYINEEMWKTPVAAERQGIDWYEDEGVINGEFTRDNEGSRGAIGRLV